MSIGFCKIRIIIENAVQIVAALIVTLIGVLGTRLTAKIGKRNELANINAATNEAVRAAHLTVLELQQTQKAMDKMSEPAKNLLTAAGVDITAVIKDAGEAMIQNMKK